MEHSTGVEVPSILEQSVTSAEMLGVTRLLIENVRTYGNHLVSSEVGPYVPGAFDETIKELIERFYELAGPQLPEWVIDTRLGVNHDEFGLNDLLVAIDAELEAWQGGGLVISQVEPLHEFTDWLYGQHTPEALEAVTDEAVQRILRRNTVRAARVLQRR